MSNSKTNSVATQPLAGDALAPRLGAAQPPLDLSLGHIGTTGDKSTVEVHQFGPFKIVFDLTTREGTVFTDVSAFSNRQHRRSAEREFVKTVSRIGVETGFVISMGGAA